MTSNQTNNIDIIKIINISFEYTYNEVSLRNKIETIFGKDYDIKNFLTAVKTSTCSDLMLDNIGILLKYSRLHIQSNNLESENTQYKFKEMFNFYKLLIETRGVYEYILSNIKDMYWLLVNFIKIDKSQYLIDKQKLTNIVNKMSEEMKIYFYFDVGSLSNLPTFLIVDSLIDTKYKTLTINNINVLSVVAKNSDLRLLKHVLNNITSYIDLTSITNLSNVINNCFSYNIPKKYNYKRLKLINEKINLSPYFNDMIPYLYNIDTIIKFNSYYGKNHSFNDRSIEKIYSLMLHSQIYIDKVINIFTKLVDKSKFIFLLILNNYITDVDKYLYFIKHVPLYYLESNLKNIICKIISKPSDIVIPTQIFKLISKDIITKITNESLISYISINKICYKYIKYLIPYVHYFEFTNLSLKLNMEEKLKILELNNNNNNNQIQNLKFKISNFEVKTDNMLKSFNCLIFHKNVYLRKYMKIKNLQKKINMINVINELKYYKPNNNHKILKNGSRLYQIELNKFNKIPPRTLMYNEIQTLNNKEMLIRQKADGYLVDCLPYIESSKLNNKSIKAEFIEDLDLYLVFDVDMEDYLYNNINCVHERYNYLRELGNQSLLNKELIEDYGTLQEHILKEKDNFDKFMKEPYDDYRIYPKAAWKIKLNDEFINCLINDNKNENSLVPYDGYILSQYNGERELKLKPLQDQTIDLYYNSKMNTLCDRDNHSWNHLLKLSEKSKYQSNKIYRFSPILNNSNIEFKFDGYRFDKKKANPNKIVNNIISYIRSNLLNNKLVKGEIYYPSKQKKVNTNWKEITDIQNQHLNSFLKKLIPNKNKDWLDLGCGSGRLLKFIKKYDISSYTGIDIDLNQLVMGLNNLDSSIKNENTQYVNIDNKRFIYGDLKKEWNNENYLWDSVDNDNIIFERKFDYVICNFSIPHFIGDTYWENINKITTKESLLLFNCVNNKIKTTEWRDKDSYLKYGDNKVQFKFPIHTNELEEEYISEDMINNYCTKYGWEIDVLMTPPGDNLDSFYNWYILKKLN